MGRVVVVDDDEVAAIGAKVVLNRIGFDAVETRWKDLPIRGPLAGNADMLIAVVRRDRASWDRYRCLHKAGDLRSYVPAGTRIVVVTETAEAANPLLGLRLHQAGVDEMHGMGHIQSVDGLAGIAAGELIGRGPCPPPAMLAPVCVGRQCDPTQIMELIARLAQRDPAYMQAFAPGVAQSASGLTRRRAHTLRVKIARIGDLSPDPSRRTGGPVRDESVPRWSQVVSFVNQIRGWRPEDEVLDLADERPTNGPSPSNRLVLRSVG